MTTHEMALEAAHVVYERYGQSGDLKTARTSDERLNAIISAYLSTLLSGDAGELVEELLTLKAGFAADGDNFGMEVSEAFHEAATLITAQAAEIARCHARLEIDHHFVLHPDRPTDTVDDLVRVEIPMAERSGEIDGIECRDATITELERQITALVASNAEKDAALEPFAEAADQFGGFVSSAPLSFTVTSKLNGTLTFHGDHTVNDLRRARSAKEGE